MIATSTDRAVKAFYTVSNKKMLLWLNFDKQHLFKPFLYFITKCKREKKINY